MQYCPTRTSLFTTASVLGLAVLGVSAGLLAACATTSSDRLAELPRTDVDVGAAEGVRAAVLLDGLMNPSGLSFAPDGALMVVDSGNGRVLRVDEQGSAPYLTGFDTEYWKIDPESGAKRFLLGPLSALWMEDDVLAVTDGGKADGLDRVGFFRGPGTAADGTYTAGIAPTSDDPADLGEGNPIGLALGPDGNTLYMAGQGADAKTWVLTASRKHTSFTPLLSADEHGISTNSPMQVLVESDDTLLVLYSGAGGQEDGLLVRWSLATKSPIATYPLPGVIDPMGMDFYPGTRSRLAVVDNNWALTDVQNGSLFEVVLPARGNEVRVTRLADNLAGPVACCFGPDGSLYVAQLGARFDAGLGQVLVIGGLE
ncbi:MAG: hypothetical protein WD226_13295 [Planctomycetota bacterium]